MGETQGGNGLLLPAELGGALVLLCLVAACAALAALVAWVLRARRRRAQRAWLYAQSPVVREALRLNDSYRGSFHTYKDAWDYRVELPSKARFDSFNPDAYICQVLKENLGLYDQLLQCARGNRRAYAAYQAVWRAAFDPAPIPSEFPACFKSVQAMRTCERDELAAQELHPQTDLALTLTWSYTSPQGRNSYRAERTYHFGELEALMRDVCRQRGREESAAYQRSLMTRSLRYDVLRRDGYRCRICGRSQADGVTLEVDHIVPVSRGGKTEMSNLQTLCWDCNHGKSDKPM